MVKFSNKGRGKPSKRKTFKTKFKIEKRVKQHKKIMKREAQRMKGKGLKHKGMSKSEFLPNMFPFKNQILQEVQSTRPQTPCAQVLKLASLDFGLVTLDNNFPYVPKPKELLLKKCVTNKQKLYATCNTFIEVLEARIPLVCINEEWREECRRHNIKIISVVTKIDSVKQGRLNAHLKELQGKGNAFVCTFSTDGKLKRDCIEKILETVKEANGGTQTTVCVAGKANTGKHTLLHELCKHAGKVHDASCELFAVALTPHIAILDATFTIPDATAHPLFHQPSLQHSIIAQQESLIKLLFFHQPLAKPILSRSQVLMYYAIQDFIHLEDLLKKIGKIQRCFGKGGSVDQARVRLKILTEWFTGKLNHLLSV